jgi:hypothetical protein
MTTKRSHVDAGQLSHHTLWNKAPERSHLNKFSTAHREASQKHNHGRRS